MNTYRSPGKLKGIDVTTTGNFYATDAIRSGTTPSSLIFIMRGDTIKAITNANAFRGSIVLSSKPVTFYINKSVYDHLGDGSSLDYEAATNWSTIAARSNVSFAQIEGTTYETHYVDGTDIPTS